MGISHASGWLPAAGVAMCPAAQTVWTADQPELTEKQPVTLTWDNGKGHVFKRTIAIDEQLHAHGRRRVEAKGRQRRDRSHADPLRPHPPASGTPHVAGFYILHEGLLGVTGRAGARRSSPTPSSTRRRCSATERGKEFTNAVGGWAGITDKYWASAVIPDQKTPFNANFSVSTAPGAGAIKSYQTLVTLPPVESRRG